MSYVYGFSQVEAIGITCSLKYIDFLINTIFEIFFKNLNCINILNNVHLIILYVFM